jgi:hypothetical protein
MSYYVVVKDGAVTDCTSDPAVATERFLSRDAFGMYKVESLEDITKLLNTDWDKELPADLEVQVGNMWNYVCEGVNNIVKRAREFDETQGTKLRARAQELGERIRTEAQKSLEELREFVRKLQKESDDDPDQ